MSINAIPSELLLEIFWLTCCGDTSIRARWPSSTEYRDMLKVLLTITAVSSRWRTTALSTGSLWGHVYCDPRESTLNRDIELLKMHLNRSMDAPLHLQLIMSPLNLQPARRVAAILEPSLPRWRTASLWRYADQPAVAFTTSCPNLVKLAINRLCIQNSTLFHDADQRSQSQFALRELSVVGFDPLALLTIPCAKLVVVALHTDYSMPHVPWDIVSQFLSRCLSCVTLTVDFPIALTSRTAPLPITLPLVDTVFVSSGNYTHLLNLPRIRVLRCAGDAVSAQGERTMFPHLESVSLISSPERIGELLVPWKLSEVYDHARSLDLVGGGKQIGMVLPFLAIRKSSSDQPSHFPALDKLVIWVCRSYEAAGGSFMASLVDILEARPSLTVECDPLQIAALDRVIGAGSQEKYGARLVVHRRSE